MRTLYSKIIKLESAERSLTFSSKNTDNSSEPIQALYRMFKQLYKPADTSFEDITASPTFATTSQNSLPALKDFISTQLLIRNFLTIQFDTNQLASSKEKTPLQIILSKEVDTGNLIIRVDNSIKTNGNIDNRKAELAYPKSNYIYYKSSYSPNVEINNNSKLATIISLPVVLTQLLNKEQPFISITSLSEIINDAEKFQENEERYYEQLFIDNKINKIESFSSSGINNLVIIWDTNSNALRKNIKFILKFSNNEKSKEKTTNDPIIYEWMPPKEQEPIVYISNNSGDTTREVSRYAPNSMSTPPYKREMNPIEVLYKTSPGEFSLITPIEEIDTDFANPQ